MGSYGLRDRQDGWNAPYITVGGETLLQKRPGSLGLSKLLEAPYLRVKAHDLQLGHLGSVFLVVEPSTIVILI